MNVPEWAEELTIQVCKDYRRRLPEQMWRKSFDRHWVERFTKEDGTRLFIKRINNSSSGSYTRTRNLIKIRAGSDEQDQRLVLLHELAHHIMGRNKAHGHSLKFWRIAFELYKRYGVDMDYAYKREKDYRKLATVAYNEIAN